MQSCGSRHNASSSGALRQHCLSSCQRALNLFCCACVCAKMDGVLSPLLHPQAGWARNGCQTGRSGCTQTQ
jgi:hypothetical protein